jgi:uncharacterized membrane protein (Fun14 family)
MEILIVLTLVGLSMLTLLAIDKKGQRHLDSEEFIEDDEYFIDHW